MSTGRDTMVPSTPAANAATMENIREKNTRDGGGAGIININTVSVEEGAEREIGNRTSPLARCCRGGITFHTLDRPIYTDLCHLDYTGKSYSAGPMLRNGDRFATTKGGIGRGLMAIKYASVDVADRTKVSASVFHAFPRWNCCYSVYDRNMLCRYQPNYSPQ